MIATAGGFGAAGPAGQHFHGVPPDATRNYLLMVVLVALLVLWVWWRARMSA